MGLATDRSRCAAENVRDFGFGQVLEIPQHQHRALARRELPQRGCQVETAVNVDRTVGLNPVGYFCARVLTDPSAPSPPADLLVVDDPAHVCVRIIHPIPPAGQLGQCRLDEVLRLMTISREKLRNPKESPRSGSDEFSELSLRVHVHPRLPPQRLPSNIYDDDAAARLASS